MLTLYSVIQYVISAGASLHRAPKWQKFSVSFLTTFLVDSVSPPIDLFLVVTFNKLSLRAPLTIPFCCKPSFTPTFKAFHYQWDFFTP